ncbi:hypothetical protein SAMN04489747_2214 [Auraticoccus monumenti]|uniref:Uncharacterized protein n=1 Tax=Auraticoccus monumenti TaxID=675864 RepID=A0A1G6Z9J0_9ACTN|nr:hypothetical protein SAMN04489747_2214 [Auraticoccus monumenti]
MTVAPVVGRPEGFEMSHVGVPEAVATLPPLKRARLVLDAIDQTMRGLAAARGWPADQLDSCYEHVLDGGLGFSWEGRSKTSPSRRRRVTPRFELMDDGYGRCTLELWNHRTDELVSVSEPLLAYSTIEGFKRTSQSLTWTTDTTVRLDSYSDAFGVFDVQTELSVESEFHPWPLLVAPKGRRPAGVGLSSVQPDVSVVTPEAVAPAPRISAGANTGPRYKIPSAYRRTVGQFFGSPPRRIVEWWAQSDLAELNVIFIHDPGCRPGIRIYQRGKDVLVHVRRPSPDSQADADPVATAQADIEQALERVRGRFKLNALPTPLF